MNTNKENNLIDEFKFYHSRQCEDINRFIVVSIFEVVGIREDGKVLSFYTLDKSITYYRTIDDCCLDFGRRLRRLMDFKGFYAYQLAEQTGISEVTISRYLMGYNRPNFNSLYKICKVLNCDVNELLIKI